MPDTILSSVHGFSHLKLLQVLLPLFSGEGNGSQGS